MLAIELRTLCLAGGVLGMCVTGAAQTTVRRSLASNGAEAHGASGGPSVSGDGRFVAFTSAASDLVAGDTNGKSDVFVHDRRTGAMQRISVDSAGAEANGDSYAPTVSSDGRFVAFESLASSLVVGDANQLMDVFVRDRLLGSTTRVTVDVNGADSNGTSWVASMGGAVSADGRFVVFESSASDLVAGDTNFQHDVFVRDLQAGSTEIVSLSSTGVQGDGSSGGECISGDGRFVAFMSSSDNLVSGDTNQHEDIFVRDRLAGTTEIVSVSTTGAQSNGDSNQCSLSADGRFVAFTSAGSTLVSGDNNAAWDVYLRDRQLGTTERISLSSAGVGANAYCWTGCLSGDGRYVAFMGGATNLVSNDTNGSRDIFIRDRLIGRTTRVSLGQGQTQGNADSDYPGISQDGRYVVFSSDSNNLVSGDSNGTTDVFGRDWLGTAGVDLCQPGVGGTLACPCGNPSQGAPRGCDNSAATGGAQLSSSGVSALSVDSLVFLSKQEPATATSVLLQGDAEVLAGLVFGQGVRCLGGTMKRLYVRSATGGVVSVPGAGDPSVSARSAALGDTIVPGSNRWYAVYYRDPVVLGGCPSTNTFNVTQTQLVSWGN